MGELGFTNLLAVCAIAFAAPLLLGLVPRLLVPAVVVEIVAGIVVGPDGLGWVRADAAVDVLALLGLAMLLFLAGLELDPQQLRGPVVRTAAVAFAASLAIALVAGLLLDAAGAAQDPLLVAVVLSATSLGVVVPVLKDAGLAGRRFGQLVVVGASLADVATIVLLSLLFTDQSTSPAAQSLLVGGLALLAAAVLLGARGAARSMRLGATVRRLQDTTAQIRVRGAVLLLVLFAAVAQELGLEVILGAFVAGAVLAVADRDAARTHPLLAVKLEAIGFGLLIPVFFVASGLRFDVDALTQDAATLARVPLFLAALLVVRGLPAALYLRALGGDRRQVVAAGLLQATSLPFIVAATAIGVELGVLAPSAAAGLVAAGLLSVLALPPLALRLLRNAPVPART